MTEINKELYGKFYEAILCLETKEECGAFFEDICTIKEIRELSQRLEVAKLLREGKSYIEVSAKSGASTATISLVNRCLTYGSGGYTNFLERISEGKGDE